MPLRDGSDALLNILEVPVAVLDGVTSPEANLWFEAAIHEIQTIIGYRLCRACRDPEDDRWWDEVERSVEAAALFVEAQRVYFVIRKEREKGERMRKHVLSLPRYHPERLRLVEAEDWDDPLPPPDFTGREPVVETKDEQIVANALRARSFIRINTGNIQYRLRKRRS